MQRLCSNLLDGRDFRHQSPHVVLNAHTQRHAARWAADACAMEPHAHHTLRRDLDQLQIPAVSLHGRAYAVDNASHSVE